MCFLPVSWLCLLFSVIKVLRACHLPLVSDSFAMQSLKKYFLVGNTFFEGKLYQTRCKYFYMDYFIKKFYTVKSSDLFFLWFQGFLFSERSSHCKSMITFLHFLFLCFIFLILVKYIYVQFTILPFFWFTVQWHQHIGIVVPPSPQAVSRTLHHPILKPFSYKAFVCLFFYL